MKQMSVPILLMLIWALLAGCTAVPKPMPAPSPTTAVADAAPVVVERPSPTPIVTRVVEGVETAVMSTAIPSIAASRPAPEPHLPSIGDWLKSDVQLGVARTFPGFITDFINDSHTNQLFIITKQLGSPEIIGFNASRDEEAYHIVFDKDALDYRIFEDTIYIVARNLDGDHSSIVQARTATAGTLLWQTELFLGDVRIFDVSKTGLLIADHNWQANYTAFHLINKANGQTMWYSRPQVDCITARNTLVFATYIQFDCDDFAIRLDASTGKFISQIDHEEVPDDTIYFNPVVSNDKFLRIRSSWEPITADNPATQENRYLEAINLTTDQVIWTQLVPADVWNFVIDDEVLIYGTHNQIIRLSIDTGHEIWRTTLETEERTGLLLLDDWLLVGSANGYLHLIDVRTGQLTWQQGIWASISPRPYYIDPRAWTSYSVIVFSDLGFLELAPEGLQEWKLVSTESTPTFIPPEPTSTATPHPILTPPAANEQPPAPASLDQWPAFLMAFLNAHPGDNTAIDNLLSDWLANRESIGRAATAVTRVQDFNRDGLPDMLIVIDIDNYFLPGWVLLAIQEANGSYYLAWVRPATTPQFVTVADLNNDGITDFIYNDTVYGASQSFVTILPVGWNGSGFVDLSSEPIASTNVLPQQIRIEDINGDGKLEIIIRGGTYGSAAAGPNRTSTYTYGWTDTGYVLLSQVPDLPQGYYFFLMDANTQFTAGNYAEAIQIYEDSLFSGDAIYDFQADHQRAFAEFQLMLAYLLLGDETNAAAWATTGNYTDKLYGQVKQVFWDTYQATRDWTTAAEAARTRVRQAGYARAQLVSWVGYANVPLTLEEICPCTDCLQGTLGSPYYP